jgi:hypothetical protein
VKILDKSHPLYGRGQRLSDAHIVELYAETKDAVLVGIKAGVSSTTVLNRVRAMGGVVHPPGHNRGRTRRVRRLSDDELCRLYAQEGYSGPKLADMAGCSVRQVYHILEARGVPRRRPSEHFKKFTAAGRKPRDGPGNL